MKFDSQKHQRRSLRWKNYDYSQAGAYYLTIDVQNRECLFGKISNNEMILNEAGKMVHLHWSSLPERFQNIELDISQVMPNHFHGIVVITESIGASLVDAQKKKPTLGDIIGAFKSITTNEYIDGVDNKKWPRFYKRLWQRNYYEHVIRDEKDLNRIRDYIQSNPANWEEDQENQNYKRL